MYRIMAKIFPCLLIIIALVAFSQQSACAENLSVLKNAAYLHSFPIAASINNASSDDNTNIHVEIQSYRIPGGAQPDIAGDAIEAAMATDIQSIFTPSKWKAPYIQIDGRQIAMDAQPLVQEGSVWISCESVKSALGITDVKGATVETISQHSMVTVRSLCDALGYELCYDAATERVLITTGADNSSSSHNGSIQWDEGYYSGSLLAGVPDGMGTLAWDDGSVYTGEFKNGSMTGRGTLDCPEGFTYTGSFRDGLFNGYGKWADTSGITYEGEWLDGRQNGWGTMTYASGSKWQGTFENGYRISGKFI